MLVHAIGASTDLIYEAIDILQHADRDSTVSVVILDYNFKYMSRQLQFV